MGKIAMNRPAEASQAELGWIGDTWGHFICLELFSHWTQMVFLIHPQPPTSNRLCCLSRMCTLLPWKGCRLSWRWKRKAESWPVCNSLSDGQFSSLKETFIRWEEKKTFEKQEEKPGSFRKAVSFLLHSNNYHMVQHGIIISFVKYLKCANM